MKTIVLLKLTTVIFCCSLLIGFILFKSGLLYKQSESEELIVTSPFDSRRSDSTVFLNYDSTEVAEFMKPVKIKIDEMMLGSKSGVVFKESDVNLNNIMSSSKSDILFKESDIKLDDIMWSSKSIVAFDPNDLIIIDNLFIKKATQPKDDLKEIWLRPSDDIKQKETNE